MDNDDIEIEADTENDLGDAAIEKLRTRLKKCLAEKQEYLDGWQRSKADFVNARKEEGNRRKELIAFSEERLLLELIPILDSFDLATGNRTLWESVSKEWRIGIESIRSQLVTILKSHRVEIFDPAGEPFSPAEHVAIDTLPTDREEKDQIVATVLQKGYRLEGKIIRPAHVTIYTIAN